MTLCLQHLRRRDAQNDGMFLFQSFEFLRESAKADFDNQRKYFWASDISQLVQVLSM